MKITPDIESAKMERGFFGSLTSLFLTYDEDFFRISDQYLHLPIDEYGKKVVSVGEEILQAGPIFNTYIENLDPAIMSTAEMLDDLNKERLLSTDYFWKLQEKTTRHRRWLIKTNRVTRTIKKRIKYAIDGVIQLEGSPEDLQKDLITIFQKYNKGEAHNTATIARTEMYNVVRNTEYNYMKEFSDQKKVKMNKDWFTMKDERVRTLHGNYYDKQGWKDLDAYFTGFYRRKESVIATKIKRPHDPRGQAFDVIN